MQSKKKKYSNLSIKKEKTLEIKEEPMAQINAVIKKLKKKQKIKNEDLSDMYNEKCASLCEKIENNKIEIENYKTIIFQSQQTAIAKDKEIEELTSMILSYKKKIESLEKERQEKGKQNEQVNKNEIKVEKSEDENINNLQKEVEELKKENSELKNEKDNFGKKLQETENYYKNIIAEKDKQIEELTKKLENYEKNKGVENEEVKENKEKEEHKEEEIKLENEVKAINFIKQASPQHKLLVFDNLVVENLFLCYLLCRCFSYGKIIKELVNNFPKYANNFLKDRLKINNIFSNVLYEFFYRSYNKSDLNEFAKEIYDINSVTQNEDFNAKILESDLYTDGYINDKCVQKLNEKINKYKLETFMNIITLVKNCRDFIQSTSLLENIRKFEPYLYTLNKTKIQIDLSYLTPESIGHLVTGIKYYKNKIKTVEFTGELNYDKHKECLYTYEVFYQLIASHGEHIKEISFNNIKNFNIPKLFNLTYSTNYFIKGINILIRGCPKLKEFYVNNCEISDDNMTDFEFPENREYSIINFANNKIYKLKNFKDIKTIQLILNHNKIRIYNGDNELSFTYLDISANDFSIKEFNKFMGQSSIKILNLSDMKIAKEEEGNLLSNAFNNIKDLQIIYLNNCQLNIKSLTPLLNNIKNMNILELYMSGNPFGNECMNLINNFIDSCKSLQKIDISGSKITTEGFENIVEGVRENDKIKEIVAENISNIDKDKVIDLFKFKEELKITM